MLHEEWKQANVKPVFKKGCKCKASNYRPNSLTSLVVKILKSISHSHKFHYNILNQQQHGFVDRRSILLEEWTCLVIKSFNNITMRYRCIDYLM